MSKAWKLRLNSICDELLAPSECLSDARLFSHHLFFDTALSNVQIFSGDTAQTLQGSLYSRCSTVLPTNRSIPR